MYKWKERQNSKAHNKRMQQTSRGRVKKQTGLGKESWSNGNCASENNLAMQTYGICTNRKLSKKVRHKNRLGLYDTNGLPNFNQKTRPRCNKEETNISVCRLWYFTRSQN